MSDSDPTVDSHQHFWDLDRLTYPWMPEGDNVLRRSYLPEDLAPHLERAGISKTVVVQAQMTIGEADLLFDLAASAESIAGVVTWVDLTDENVGATLDRMQEMPKFVGIRHQVHDEPDERWLLRDDVVRGLRELERRDLAYDLLLRPPHLKHILELADRVPDLRMVVDHIAKPEIAEGAHGAVGGGHRQGRGDTGDALQGLRHGDRGQPPHVAGEDRALRRPRD